MYKELVERLRKTYTVCGWDDLKSAADAIEALESELDRLRRERDQAVEELHRNTDAVPVVRCKDCKHEISTADIRARTGSYWCNYKLQPCDADDFCSYGKRKESNE